MESDDVSGSVVQSADLGVVDVAACNVQDVMMVLRELSGLALKPEGYLVCRLRLLRSLINAMTPWLSVDEVGEFEKQLQDVRIHVDCLIESNGRYAGADIHLLMDRLERSLRTLVAKRLPREGMSR